MVNCSSALVPGNAATPPLRSRTIQAGSDDKQETFDLLRIGNSRRSDGFWTERLIMKSSKGALIYKTTIAFKSKDQAKKELNKLSEQASKIIRHTDEMDDKGKVVGRRVLAQFDKKEDDDLQFRLFYTKDEVYYQIDSDSLDAISALERYIVNTSK